MDDEDTWFKPAVVFFDPRQTGHWKQDQCDACGLAPTPDIPVTLIVLGCCCYKAPYLCLDCLKKKVAEAEAMIQGGHYVSPET